MTPEDPLDREIADALEGIDLQNLEGDEETRKEGDGDGGPRLRRGVIAGIAGDDVIVELGPRMQGVVSLQEFDPPPKVGDVHHFVLLGREDDLWLLSMQEAREIAAWDELAVGSLVRARVSGQNQGGLELKIGRNPAFMPASQVATDRDADLASFLGRTLTCEVLELDRARRRCVLSHRRVMESERLQAMQESVGKLHAGLILTGRVSRIEKFGAFVDLGNGLEGLLHVSNISLRRVENPGDVLTVGQEVQVKVLEISEGGRRIGLGMKQLEPDPWEGLEQRLSPDTIVSGRVTRVVDFGAFVEIEPGLEGLLHVSQLGRERVRNVSAVVQQGQEITVRIVAIDVAARRISLSRLDPRGALIGSDEAVEGGLIEEILAKPGEQGLGTNLGSVFRKALDQRKDD